jgi:hypothetical protein
MAESVAAAIAAAPLGESKSATTAGASATAAAAAGPAVDVRRIVERVRARMYRNAGYLVPWATDNRLLIVYHTLVALVNHRLLCSVLSDLVCCNWLRAVECTCSTA